MIHGSLPKNNFFVSLVHFLKPSTMAIKPLETPNVYETNPSPVSTATSSSDPLSNRAEFILRQNISCEVLAYGE